MPSPVLGALLTAGLLAGGCGAPAPERPNVLVILVDTLRADHLTSYGYSWDTAPEIERRLARRGVLAERAYAQAPWTLPSTASFLTGRLPAEVVGSDPESYVLSERASTLAEELAALGYETAAFVGNPLLHEDNGFSRGAGTFFTPPLTWESLRWVDARTINDKAIPWLEERAAGGEPFFLYLHYIDPHDPYQNPDVADGRTPWDPGYDGRIRGDSMDELFQGNMALRQGEAEREADLRHLVALYDSEIRYVDRYVGELLDAIPRPVLRNTLVVFTSDHGEEFQEHGGWKHAQALYEEQIRVPLVLRWDAWLPAGRRLSGVVRLVDVYPTILAAAGGEAPPGLPGVDLLPALRGDEPLPDLVAYAQHLTFGPERAAVVAGKTKLILFNENVPFEPPNRLHAHLWRLDEERMERVELYDLESDPGERDNLAGARPETVRRLAPRVEAGFDRSIGGLRIVARNLPPGSVLTGTVELESPPQGWRRLFLSPEDRVEVEGRRVAFELHADLVGKGVVLRGAASAVAAVEAVLRGADGDELAAGLQVRLGRGGQYRGGPVAAGELEGRPRSFDAPVLHLWSAPAPLAGTASEGVREENRRRLEALGYVG